MSFIPRPQEIYRHFKGNLYQIITIAQHSETGEQLVIYQALYGEYQVYARELSMFLSPVDRVKYPEASQLYRFERQGAEGDPRRQEMAEAKKTMTAQPASSHPVIIEAAPAVEGPGTDARAKTEIASEEEFQLDPMLVRFLDADTYEERLNILTGLHHRITQEMITTMAVASDVEVGDGELEERYGQLKTCLLTLEKYECNRLRG